MKKLPESGKPTDTDAWLNEIEQVTRLKQPEETPSAPLILPEVEQSIRYEGLYNPNSFNTLTVGNLDNVDAKTGEKFRKGEFKIEARLDLHGRTEKEAFAAVTDFIQDSYRLKRRCVLIITGKGQKDGSMPWYETRGVIREALPSWLNLPEIRPFILSMSPATQADGGSGAMYVLLKRHRASN